MIIVRYCSTNLSRIGRHIGSGVQRSSANQPARHVFRVANLCVDSVLVYDLSGPTVCRGREEGERRENGGVVGGRHAHEQTNDTPCMMRWYEYPRPLMETHVDVQYVVVETCMVAYTLVRV